MSCLSVFGHGSKGFRAVANPIYVTSPIEDPASAARIEFEVLEADATLLRDLVGEQEHYALGSEWDFWGVLDSLVPTESTHPALNLIRGRGVLRGVMTVYPEAASVN